MKVAILCGGKGTRLAELTAGIPKGLVLVGDMPIILHIMKYFASFGHTDFVLMIGYMGHRFVEYFREHPEPDWTIEFVDSGERASKSRRLLDARNKLDSDRFFLSYGDDLCDVDLDAVLSRNEASNATVTLTAVQPMNPFGLVQISDTGFVYSFREKEKLKDWINGGYMVVRPEIFSFLEAGELEPIVFPFLVNQGAIDVHKHTGFWMSMNTFKESKALASIWSSPNPPWKRWSDE